MTKRLLNIYKGSISILLGLTNTLNFHWESVSSNIDYWFMFEISNRTMAYLSQRRFYSSHSFLTYKPFSYINQEESKKVFSEKEIFWYGICLSPSNPSTVIYTHTDSFHAFKWMLCACRKYLQALVYGC